MKNILKFKGNFSVKPKKKRKIIGRHRSIDIRYREEPTPPPPHRHRHNI